MFGLTSSYTFYNDYMYIITHSRKKYNKYKLYSVSCLLESHLSSVSCLITVCEDLRWAITAL